MKIQKHYEKFTQYSCRNCLILHRIKEENYEDINQICTKFLKDHLEIEVSQFDIDRRHRLGDV